MGEYIFKRTYQLIIVFFIFLVSSYLLFNAIPGNAFSNLLLNPTLPPDAYEQVLATYGLDKPLFERLQLYIINFFKGDFGYSYKYFPKGEIAVSSGLDVVTLLTDKQIEKMKFDVVLRQTSSSLSVYL